MNIDRKTPIGKAVESPLTGDDRPEVEGHRLVARMQDNDLGRILRATDEHAPEVEAQTNDKPEVQGHRLMR